MLIKERDNHDADIARLQKLLECQLTAKQRLLIERELKCISSGARGEGNSAYYIDFQYKDSRNWAVIHDLRLEYRGFAAQIDHLLINRFLHFYVLESKNYYYGIKITPEGEFLTWNGKTLIALESPIEQNKRHIELLQRVVQQPGFMPTKLGVSITPSFFSYVMVAPNSRVDRPPSDKFDTSMVIKADALIAAIDKRLDGTSPVDVVSSLAKAVSQETLEAFARRLIRLHRPSEIDYAARFGVAVNNTPAPMQQQVIGAATDGGNGTDIKKDAGCEACGGVVDAKVANYCRSHSERFGGKVLCRSCQRTPSAAPVSQAISITPNEGVIATASLAAPKGACQKCGAAVDGKVVFFCRMNKAKFEGRILCRDCQKTP